MVPDSIEAYLDSPPIAKPEVKATGGVLKYWESCRTTRHRLAQMALDFLSAPGLAVSHYCSLRKLMSILLASSVDAERTFSGGRLQVNHLQHQMSSQSFKAQVAVGSWYNTPLLPNMSSATAIITNKTSKGKNQTEPTIEIGED